MEIYDDETGVSTYGTSPSLETVHSHVWRVEQRQGSAPRRSISLLHRAVLVPLLVVIIGMIGLIFGQEAAQGYIVEQIAALVGPQSAAAIKDMIQRANQPTTGIVATVVATATLLLGASGVFGQLQDSLNSIWGVQPKEGRRIWGLIKDRFISFAALLGTGFLLLVSLVLSAGLAAFGKWFGGGCRPQRSCSKCSSSSSRLPSSLVVRDDV